MSLLGVEWVAKEQCNLWPVKKQRQSALISVKKTYRYPAIKSKFFLFAICDFISLEPS
jgi:hypothetical protein